MKITQVVVSMTHGQRVILKGADLDTRDGNGALTILDHALEGEQKEVSGIIFVAASGCWTHFTVEWNGVDNEPKEG